ncbi:MAG: ATP-binding protein [Gammaproteobacteria bacterium]|nr:ATP-binding protein [Gammaproteobacteria bacterium]
MPGSRNDCVGHACRRGRSLKISTWLLCGVCLWLRSCKCAISGGSVNAVLITGTAGVGKSFLACALAHSACRMDYSVRFFRLPRLIDRHHKAAHRFYQRKRA